MTKKPGNQHPVVVVVVVVVVIQKDGRMLLR
jgi:hypothetical protein